MDKDKILQKYDNDLTIILPLYSRDKFTLRWFLYASSQRCPFKIIVADGSKNKFFKNKIEYFSKMLRIEYQEYPEDQGYFDYYRKMSLALKKVETKYVLLVDNDDFLNFDSLYESIIFLENHPDYALCGGKVNNFYIKGKCLDGHAGLYGDRSYFYNSVYETATSVEDEHDFERVRTHMAKYVSNFYDVHRTVVYQNAFDKLDEIKLHDIFLAELFLSNYALLFGKTKKLDISHLSRQSNPPSSCAQGEKLKGNGMMVRLLATTWSDDLDKYCRTLALQISMKNTDDEKYLFIKKGYADYLKLCLLGSFYKRFVGIFISIKGFVIEKFKLKKYMSSDLLPYIKYRIFYRFSIHYSQAKKLSLFLKEDKKV